MSFTGSQSINYKNPIYNNKLSNNNNNNNYLPFNMNTQKKHTIINNNKKKMSLHMIIKEIITLYIITIIV